MYGLYIKRIIDLIICIISAVIIFPILVVLTILGLFFMKGNPFYFQNRTGKNEVVFKLVKFRSMTNEVDNEGRLLSDENRLNGYGRFLRRTSLDEIPEIFNIIAGDMSIIGPRPLLPKDVEYMDERQHRRHTVRPGLTGLAQCNGRNSLNWDEKLDLDIEYVDNISFLLDFSIFFKTIKKVVMQENVEYDVVEEMDLKEWNELKHIKVSDTTNKK